MKHVKRMSVPKAQFFPEDYPGLMWWFWLIASVGTLKFFD